MYSTICSSVTPPRLPLPLLFRRRPPESDPEPEAWESLASLEEDGVAFRRLLRRWRLRLRRGEGERLESEASSESDGDGLRRRRRRDELSRSFFGMSAIGGKAGGVGEEVVWRFGLAMEAFN
jgi:hypothetical protein